MDEPNVTGSGEASKLSNDAPEPIGPIDGTITGNSKTQSNNSSIATAVAATATARQPPQAASLSEETTLRIKRQILASQVAAAHTAAPLPPAILQAAKLPRPGGLATGMGSDVLAELLRQHRDTPQPLGDAKVTDYYRRTVPAMAQGGLVPTLGLDWIVLREERERLLEVRAEHRIKQLEEMISQEQMSGDNNGASEGDEKPTKLLIELKMLRLRHVQREWRERMVRFVHELKKLDCLVNRTTTSTSGGGRRGRKQTLRDSRVALTSSGQSAGEEARMARRERHQKEREINEFLKALLTHHRDLTTQWRMAIQRRARLVKQVMHHHHNFEREETKRSERLMKERMRALKNDDEVAYYKLLDQEKDVRLTYLLRQTDEFLRNLADKVRAHQEVNQQKLHLSTDPVVKTSPTLTVDDGILNETINDFYHSIHRTPVHIDEQPKLLQGGRLKEYQMKGLQWMVSLHENQLNGMLADEMGLGKTIQTIALIAYLIESRGLTGPFLIVVPLSTLTNWSMEFEKWAPAIHRIEYRGLPSQRKALQHQIRHGQFNVLITTYEYVIKDKPVLSKLKWLYLIVDEGHRMKNTHSKLAIVLAQHYSMRHRLILTGTPLQNNLPELWSLLNFLLPDVFNSCRTFEDWFNAPFANTGERMELNEEELLLVIRRLHKVLHPFLLRRMKRDVEAELPEKLEVVLKCPMSALQSSLYRTITSVNSDSENGVEGNAKDARHFGIRRLNNTIMQLRKICNHPFVFEEVERQVNPHHATNDLLWRVAGKFELLYRILPKFVATGHKVLMFFQMTQIMTIMEDFLHLLHFPYLRLDGSTKAEDRSDLLCRFNAPDSPYLIFLLSTRAGGLGLNLQTADTVIIFDSDWNPHQDLQAQDRAHRIGQTREVRIFRLVTVESVEEYILKRAQHKLSLDGKIIQAGKFDQRSTNEERDELLRAILEREAIHDEATDIYDDEELNEIIARNESELETFKKIDSDRAAQEAEVQRKTGVRKARLIEAHELPKVYLSINGGGANNGDEGGRIMPGGADEGDEDAGSVASEDLSAVATASSLGVRSVRRKEVSYNERMSDDKWLRLQMESDTGDGEGKRAKEGGNRRGRKKKQPLQLETLSDDTTAQLEEEVEEEEEEEISPGKRSSKQSPLPKLKFKIPKLSIPTTNGTIASTTTISSNSSMIAEAPIIKSHPRLYHESRLSSEVRANIIRKIFSLVENCTEPETGRYRSDLFLELPSRSAYPDYYRLIGKPISLAEIEPQLDQYESISQFMADLDRMFANARQYNVEGSQVYDDAQVMQQEAHDKLRELLAAEGEFDSQSESLSGDDEEENEDDNNNEEV